MIPREPEPPTTPPVVPNAGVTSTMSITGGSGGVRARYTDMRILANRSEELAEQLAGSALRGHAILLDPNIVASAILNPGGVARAEQLLFEALDGSSGISALGLSFIGRSLSIKATCTAYEIMDWAAHDGLAALRWAGGFALGLAGGVAGAAALGAFGPLGGLVGFGLGGVAGGGVGMGLTALLANPGAGIDLFKAWWADGDISADDLQRIITEHPGIIDDMIGMSPGWLTSLGIPVGDVPSAAGLLSLLYPENSTDGVARFLAEYGLQDPPLGPDGTPLDEKDLHAWELRRKELFPPDGIDRFANPDPPGGPLQALLQGIDQRNSGLVDDNQGRIDVKIITDANGNKSYIVDIPGTQDWHLSSIGTEEQFLNDFGTNLRGLSGASTAYERAIAEALKAAGASPNAPVMLVGHSQGGIIAMNAAQHTANGTFPYNVTHVITAGSPVATISVPNSVQVLSLENTNDIVPHLDSEENPDLPNRTTVSFTDSQGSVGANHSIHGTYLPAAVMAEQSGAPSVTNFLNSASGFTAQGNQVTTQVYQATRK